jgi:hypothetical protein
MSLRSSSGWRTPVSSGGGDRQFSEASDVRRSTRCWRDRRRGTPSAPTRTDPRPGGSGPLDRAPAEEGDDQQRQAGDGRGGPPCRRRPSRPASISASLRVKASIAALGGAYPKACDPPPPRARVAGQRHPLGLRVPYVAGGPDLGVEFLQPPDLGLASLTTSSSCRGAYSGIRGAPASLNGRSGGAA